MKKHRFDAKKFRVKEGESIHLSKRSTKAGQEFNQKEEGLEALRHDNALLQLAQAKLFASGRRSLLVILQGMDAAGKDGTIRHVMSGVNPQGCRIFSFRAPNSEEVLHHFLWRPMRFLPERGMLTIFNRSYYEEVMVVRVHPEFLTPQRLPPYKKLSEVWKRRYNEILAFEKTLVTGGTSVLKFFLHVSKEEQKARLLERLMDKEKRWKFNERDLDERNLWDDYQKAIEDALEATSTKQAPWFIIPADDKWYARAAIADIIAGHLESLDLEFPKVSNEDETIYANLIERLKNE
ncbi:MAG: polyphosphate kinase 2 family protein [Planctomycetes bacterium]|nr:polyphosphate kinase 2 family protein [Planctomycetota bacterium]